jgi:hypothetical protein
LPPSVRAIDAALLSGLAQIAKLSGSPSWWRR